jgi:hypothetical protein
MSKSLRLLQLAQSSYKNVFWSSRTGDKGASAGTLVNPRTRGNPLEPQQLLRPSRLGFAPTLGSTNVSPSLWASRNRRLGQNSPRPQLRCLKSGKIYKLSGVKYFLYGHISAMEQMSGDLSSVATSVARAKEEAGIATLRVGGFQRGVASFGARVIDKRVVLPPPSCPCTECRKNLIKKYCSSCTKKEQLGKIGGYKK